jgi:hypothetical protein
MIQPAAEMISSTLTQFFYRWCCGKFLKNSRSPQFSNGYQLDRYPVYHNLTHNKNGEYKRTAWGSKFCNIS